jgi:enamine deaminase RidA (YjgF/YER057c/UK114 family)
MLKNTEEKRGYPRVKTSLKVGISQNISGSAIDFSETGLNFSCTETFSSPAISVQFRFPGEKDEFKTNAKLVWKRNLEGGSSLYGVEFIDLNETQKAALRKELIKTQIQPLLAAITIPETRKQVSDFFLKDMLEYISGIIKLSLRTHRENDYSEDIENKLDHIQTQILLKGYCLDELLSDKVVMKKVKDNFRQLVGVWAYKSSIVKRGFEKPRGYPGDYRMLEIVYDNKPISENKNIGLYFDTYFLKSPYAVAVRTRKDRLREFLQRFINETNLTKVNILDIACGSCREIAELLPSLKTKVNVSFFCLDWDEEALSFSRDKLTPLAPKNIEFKFIKEDIMNIIKDESVAQSLGKQNLIYSIGLIDYLPDSILKKLIHALYQLLLKDGKLILTHKNREKNFPPIPLDWFCDWKFVSRDKEEVYKLFYDCGISGFSLFLEVDDFGYIYYFTITKNK